MSSSAEPTKLGDYQLLEKLGQGGMAVVYRGERTGEAGFKKRVALKRMLPQYRRNPSLLERFAAEARTNARLDHPNLVAVVDFGTEPEPYLVMEYVDGVTLALLLQRLVERGQKMEIAAALFIAAEVGQGLDHAHRKRDDDGNPLGIVHRDVSPQNVLLSSEGAVKVSDFGLVKAADNVVQTGTGVPIGKMSYMAPEQAEHHEVDARADVFSLGIVCWEMLSMRTLMPPNDALRAAQMLQQGTFPAPSTLRPEVSPELDAAVMSCLHADPGQRTPTAAAFGMQVREILHADAPGYGRDQLARLLAWAFPERGWIIDEPHATAAQPTELERRSMPHAPMRISNAPLEPAPPEEHALATTADVAPAERIGTPRIVEAAMPEPAASGTGLIWAIGLGIVGLVFIVIVVALIILIAASGSNEARPPTPPEAGEPTMQPAEQTFVTIDTGARDALAYLGARVLGVPPVQIDTSSLTSDPLIVTAAGRRPFVLQSTELAGLVASGRNTERVRLERSPHPEAAVYVANPGTVQVMGTGQALGSAPGVVLVPRTAMGGYPNLQVENAGQITPLYLEDCTEAELCIPNSVLHQPAPPRAAPRSGWGGRNITQW